MREDICSVPVSEIFEKVDGCPICRMRNIVEERLLEYVLGAAMMEPDVRVMTNKEGFCFKHFKMMAGRHSRLPLALMIESHLAEVDKKILSGSDIFGASPKSRAGKAEKHEESCFICSRIERSMAPLIATVVRLYDEQLDFRRMFDEQKELCLPHYAALVRESQNSMSKRFRGEFASVARKKARESLDIIHKDIQHFCSMFDYRNNTEEADWGNSKDSIERSILWLTSFDPDDKRL